MYITAMIIDVSVAYALQEVNIDLTVSAKFDYFSAVLRHSENCPRRTSNFEL